jgi:hypothetical protein
LHKLFGFIIILSLVSLARRLCRHDGTVSIH